MTKIFYQGPVSGFAKRLSLMRLFPPRKSGFLKVQKSGGKPAIWLKKQGTYALSPSEPFFPHHPYAPWWKASKNSHDQLNTLRRPERRSVPKCLQG